MSASVDELRATVENLSLSPAPTVCSLLLFDFSFLGVNTFRGSFFSNDIVPIT